MNACCKCTAFLVGSFWLHRHRRSQLAAVSNVSVVVWWLNKRICKFWAMAVQWQYDDSMTAVQRCHNNSNNRSGTHDSCYDTTTANSSTMVVTLTGINGYAGYGGCFPAQ